MDTHQGAIEKVLSPSTCLLKFISAFVLVLQVVTLGCFGVENCISFEIVASLGQEGQQPPSGWRFAQLEVGILYYKFIETWGI